VYYKQNDILPHLLNPKTKFAMKFFKHVNSLSFLLRLFILSLVFFSVSLFVFFVIYHGHTLVNTVFTRCLGSVKINLLSIFYRRVICKHLRHHQTLRLTSQPDALPCNIWHIKIMKCILGCGEGKKKSQK
jgi:hypothetical protein